jgi:hypothetical protein
MKNMLRPRLADVPALSVAGNLPFQLAGLICHATTPCTFFVQCVATFLRRGHQDLLQSMELTLVQHSLIYSL